MIHGWPTVSNQPQPQTTGPHPLSRSSREPEKFLGPRDRISSALPLPTRQPSTHPRSQPEHGIPLPPACPPHLSRWRLGPTWGQTKREAEAAPCPLRKAEAELAWHRLSSTHPYIRRRPATVSPHLAAPSVLFFLLFGVVASSRLRLPVPDPFLPLPLDSIRVSSFFSPLNNLRVDLDCRRVLRLFCPQISVRRCPGASSIWIRST